MLFSNGLTIKPQVTNYNLARVKKDIIMDAYFCETASKVFEILSLMRSVEARSPRLTTGDDKAIGEFEKFAD